MSKVSGSSKQFVVTFKMTVTVTTKWIHLPHALPPLHPRKCGHRFTSITFFPGCSAAVSFSPSSLSLVMVASLGSRHLLIKFCERHTGRNGWAKCAALRLIRSLCVHLQSYLILLLAGRIVQVGVAPIIVDSLLGLLVHPVQLIGAALHIVPQGCEVSLASGGIGLMQGKG